MSLILTMKMMDQRMKIVMFSLSMNKVKLNSMSKILIPTKMYLSR